MSARVFGAEELREDRFREDRRHAEEGGDPHPEDGAWAAHHHRGGDAGEVAGADLCGNGRRERLKGGHARLVGRFAEEGEAAEDLLHGGAELANLHESQLDGHVDPRPDEKRDEAVHPPEQTVDALDDVGCVVHERHLKRLLLLVRRRLAGA